MASDESTIVAVATPPGQGAIAIVRLSGSDALRIALRLCGGKNFRARYATRVQIHDERGRPLDDALALYFPGPHSATGEDVVEFHVHGSPILARELVRACIACGAHAAAPGEFTRRSWLAGKLDLTGVDAVGALIASESTSAARAALANLGGSLATRIAELRLRLRTVLEELAASIDFPDEVAEPSRERIAAMLSDLDTELQQLQRDGEIGRVLREGLSLAIVGPPNAGKSSLLNALLGEERVLVSEVAGTTRDSIEEAIIVDGVLVRAIDTAGIRAHADRIEAMGIERSRRALAGARVALLVLDGSMPLSSEGEALLEQTAARDRIVFFNKADIARTGVRACPGEVVIGSVHDVRTLGELRAAIARVGWGGERPDLERPHLAYAMQFDAAARAREALGFARMSIEEAQPLDLVANDLRLTDAALGQIDLATASEELVDAIFARFCIGK